MISWTPSRPSLEAGQGRAALPYLLAAIGTLLVGCHDGAYRGLGQGCDDRHPCGGPLACSAARCVLPAAADAAAGDSGSAAPEVRSDRPPEPIRPDLGGGASDAPADAAPPVSDAPTPPSSVPFCFGPDEPNRIVGYLIPFCLTGTPWPQSTIEVCWSPAAVVRPDFARLGPAVESFVRENFNRPVHLELVGWQPCAPAAAGSRGGRLVISLIEGSSFEADLGYGAGGDRHLQIGVAASPLEAPLIEGLLKLLGLTYRLGQRPPGGPALTAEEAGGLQVFFGRRPGGSVVGAAGRCLQADAGPAGAGDCTAPATQDWQLGTDGSLNLVGRPALALEARPSTSEAALAPRQPGAPAQTWAIKRAAIHSDADKCLGIPGGIFVEGRGVALLTCTGAEAQQWEVEPRAGRIRHGEFCLAVAGGEAREGALLQIQRCAAVRDQVFAFPGNNQIAYADGQCINVFFDPNRDGAEVGLWPCTTTLFNGNEMFYFRGQIENRSTCLGQTQSPGAVTLGPCGSDPLQLWDIHLRPIVPR